MRGLVRRRCIGKEGMEYELEERDKAIRCLRNQLHFK